MNKLFVISLRLLAVAGVSATLAACGHSPPQGEEGTSAIRSQALISDGTDVEAIRFDVTPVSCVDGSPTGAPISDSAAIDPDQTIPGNIPNLQNQPLDQKSAHRFADSFQVVPAGCYDVVATPVDADGNTSQDCAAAFKNGVVVSPAHTTEIFMINQCAGADAGAIDAIAALNHEPTIADVKFKDSKFSCGSPTEICAQAKDQDADPLELVLSSDDCTVAALPDAPAGSQCWNLTCNSLGRHDLSLKVYDLLGTGQRIEDFLASEGYPNESHAELSFFANVDGITLWPDRDGDGFGDANSPATVFCAGEDTTGFVPNRDDCDDTDANVSPAAAEVCGDGRDNNCNGRIDESCGIGYYDMEAGQGVDQQVPPITTAGGTPVQVFDLSSTELGTLSALVVENPSNDNFGAEYLANLGNIQSAVSNGMVLVIHDRFVSTAETILPGGAGFTITRFLGTNIDVLDATTLVTNGPGGIIDNTTLDNGNFSLHGFTVVGSLPGDSVNIFSTDDPTQIVEMCYKFGSGAVLYSTIPLDFYLGGNGVPPAGDNFRNIYAPNVMAYAAAGACK